MQDLTTATRTLTRCIVCGFAEVRTDEVVDRGVVMLSECPRCEHRSTWRVPAFEMQPAAWPARPVRVDPLSEEESAAA